jgi:hypothetical protein
MIHLTYFAVSINMGRMMACIKKCPQVSQQVDVGIARFSVMTNACFGQLAQKKTLANVYKNGSAFCRVLTLIFQKILCCRN